MLFQVIVVCYDGYFYLRMCIDCGYLLIWLFGLCCAQLTCAMWFGLLWVMRGGVVWCLLYLVCVLLWFAFVGYCLGVGCWCGLLVNV